jgi:hypothetical protein
MYLARMLMSPLTRTLSRRERVFMHVVAALELCVAASH